VNTLFVITAEEGDHVVAANPTNPGCDGVTTPCTYGNTPGNEVGELSLNFRGLLQAETGITTVASVNSDDAPDIYLKGNPIPADPTLRALERASGTLTAVNPISGATDTIAQDMANPAEFNILHMLTFDPLRTPSFTIFANPDYFVTGSTACGASATRPPPASRRSQALPEPRRRAGADHYHLAGYGRPRSRSSRGRQRDLVGPHRRPADDAHFAGPEGRLPS
jgi:hypothetical protein